MHYYAFKILSRSFSPVQSLYKRPPSVFHLYFLTGAWWLYCQYFPREFSFDYWNSYVYHILKGSSIILECFLRGFFIHNTTNSLKNPLYDRAIKSWSFAIRFPRGPSSVVGPVVPPSSFWTIFLNNNVNLPILTCLFGKWDNI